jgi:hypothetical protein
VLTDCRLEPATAWIIYSFGTYERLFGEYAADAAFPTDCRLTSITQATTAHDHLDRLVCSFIFETSCYSNPEPDPIREGRQGFHR